MSSLYIALLIGAISFGGGYHVRDLMADADKAQAVSFALKKQAAEEEISRAEEIDLIKSQQKTKVVYKTVVKEVVKHVPQIQKSDSECNLSVGTVRVFNRAANNDVPETTAVNDSGNTESSTVKESDLIDYGLEVINQYNEVKDQCNALISWHNNVSKDTKKKD